MVGGRRAHHLQARFETRARQAWLAPAAMVETTGCRQPCWREATVADRGLDRGVGGERWERSPERWTHRCASWGPHGHGRGGSAGQQVGLLAEAASHQLLAARDVLEVQALRGCLALYLCPNTNRCVPQCNPLCVPKHDPDQLRLAPSSLVGAGLELPHDLLQLRVRARAVHDLGQAAGGPPLRHLGRPVLRPGLLQGGERRRVQERGKSSNNHTHKPGVGKYRRTRFIANNQALSCDDAVVQASWEAAAATTAPLLCGKPLQRRGRVQAPLTRRPCTRVLV